MVLDADASPSDWLSSVLGSRTGLAKLFCGTAGSLHGVCPLGHGCEAAPWAYNHLVLLHCA